MHNAGASIIEWDAPPKVFAVEAADTDDDGEPDYAIEDYGSDYGEDDTDEPQEDDFEPLF